MRASRLLSLLMLLQTRGRQSAPALAAELEVSVRTVLRDIDHLSASGVPVWADRGRNGGFQLKPGWSTRLTGLTAPEAQAMFMVGLTGPAAELGLGSAVASARLKVLSTLPEDWQRDAQRVSSRFHLDALDWYRTSSGTPHLAAVAEAVWNQRVLAMRYESWSGVRERRIEPLGLVLKAGIWYLVARPAGAGEDSAEPRTYRLTNILTLAQDEQGFSYPEGFDLAGHWQRSARRFEAGIYTGTAALRVTERGLKQLLYFNAAVAEAARASARPDAARPGWLRVEIPTESIDHATTQVLRLGTQAQALAPPELVQRLRETVAELGGLYPAA